MLLKDFLWFQNNNIRYKVLSGLFCFLVGSFIVWLVLSNSANEILLQRSMTIRQFCIMVGVIMIGIFVFLNGIRNQKFQKQFEYWILLCYFVFFLSGFFTHGGSIRSFLFQDRLDIFMDFFNSIQYDGMPYANKVIYPPFINVVYDFFGKFADLRKVMGSAYYIRESQSAMIVYCIYTTAIILCLSKIIQEMRSEDRIVSTIVIMLSAPFIFAFERGNSILFTVLCLFLFVRYYQSNNNKEKYFAFVSLGCAAGIKISPALFGLLLIRERRYKDVVVALCIGAVVFFVPFVFTDGNIIILLQNIKYTTSVFQGAVVDGGGSLRLIGTGYYINCLSMSLSLGRLLNVNLNNAAIFFNSIIFVIGICLTVYGKSIDEWKIVTLLGGIIAFCPGFSGVYNLLFLFPGILLFLNSDIKRTGKSMLYAFLFSLILIPIINLKIAAFSFSYNDLYPARLSTVLEGFALLLLVVSLEVDGSITLYQELWSRLSNNKKAIISTAGVIGCIVIYGYAFGFSSRPVQAFSPNCLSAQQSMKGFVLEDGQYKWMGKEATVLLEPSGLLNDGLLISFGQDPNNPLLAGECRIAVYINQKEFDVRRIDLGTKPYIFIEPEDLIDLEDVEGKPLELRTVILEPAIEMLPVCYIGPAQLLPLIENGSYITATTGGVHRRFMDAQLWLGEDNNILLDRTEIQDGLLIRYRVPEELVGLLEEKQLSFKIFVDGELKKTIPIYSLAQNAAVLQPEDLYDGSFSRRSVELSLKIDGGFSDKEFGYSEDKMKHSLLLDYIGPCDSSSSVRNVWVSNSVTQYFSNTYLQDNGLDIIYHVPMGILADASNYPLEVQVFRNGTLIRQQKTFVNHRSGLQVIHVPALYFREDEHIDRFDFKVKAVDASWEEGVYDHGKVFLQWFGPRKLVDEVSESAEVDEIEPYLDGLRFQKNQNTWQMGKRGTFILPQVQNGVAELYIEYLANHRLFEANENQPMQLSIRVNGDEVAILPIEPGKNEYRVSNRELQAALRKNEDGAIVELWASHVYNLSRMKILRGEADDRSIEIIRMGLRSSL